MLGTMKLFTSGASPPTTIGIPTPSMISKTTTAVAILTTSTCHRFTSSDLLFGQFRGLTSSKKHGNSRSHAIPRLRKVPQELFRRARARYSSWRPVPGVEETGPAASPERFTNRFHHVFGRFHPVLPHIFSRLMRFYKDAAPSRTTDSTSGSPVQSASTARPPTWLTSGRKREERLEAANVDTYFGSIIWYFPSKIGVRHVLAISDLQCYMAPYGLLLVPLVHSIVGNISILVPYPVIQLYGVSYFILFHLMRLDTHRCIEDDVHHMAHLHDIRPPGASVRPIHHLPKLPAPRTWLRTCFTPLFEGKSMEINGNHLPLPSK